MSEIQYRSEIKPTIEEDSSVEKTLEAIPIEQRVNIVKQSFIVGAGSIDAHNIYVYFLCKTFSLTPRQAGLLLRKCFYSLGDEDKVKIIQAAYHTHLDEMKRTIRVRKKTQDRLESPVGNFEAATLAIEDNLPAILGDRAFDDVTDEEETLISQLPKDFTPKFDSNVVQVLRDICTKRGYYNELEWKKRLQ